MLSSANFHNDFKSLIINSHEVGVLGLSLQREISPEALSALIAENGKGEFSWRAKDSTLVHFRLEQENGQGFILHVKAKPHLFSACTKCLDEIEHEIEIDLSMRLLEQETVDNATDDFELSFDSESAEDENEEVVGYFSKMSIDLGLILREQIFLTVPDYPRCGDKTALKKESCEPSSYLASTDSSARANPFVKLFKKS